MAPIPSDHTSPCRLTARKNAPGSKRNPFGTMLLCASESGTYRRTTLHNSRAIFLAALTGWDSDHPQHWALAKHRLSGQQKEGQLGMPCLLRPPYLDISRHPGRGGSFVRSLSQDLCSPFGVGNEGLENGSADRLRDAKSIIGDMAPPLLKTLTYEIQ